MCKESQKKDEWVCHLIIPSIILIIFYGLITYLYALKTIFIIFYVIVVLIIIALVICNPKCNQILSNCLRIDYRSKCCFVFPIIILIFILLGVYLLIVSDYDFKNIFIIELFLIGILIGISPIICHLVKNRELCISSSEIRDRLSEHSLGIAVSGLIFTGILLVAFYYHPPPQIVSVVEPQEFKVTIPAGDSINRTISIKNIGISMISISIMNDMNDSWINGLNITSEIIPQEKQKYFNFLIKVPSNTTSGEYRRAITISFENKTDIYKNYKEIPIILNVTPKAQFRATIYAPFEVNTSDFKVNVGIENTGNIPIYGVNLSINSGNTTSLDIDDVKNKNKSIAWIPSNTAISNEWLMKVKNKTGWETIQVNINSSNAGNQIITTRVNLTSP